MTNLPRIDIINDNFDIFFERQSKKIGQHEKELLPKPYLYKLFKGGAELDVREGAKFSFLQKLFVLWKALKYNIYIVVEDKDGMGIEDFYKFKEQHKKRNYSIGQAGNVIANENFVLGNKELSDTFSYLNTLCTGRAYNFLSGTKNRKTKVNHYLSHMKYFAKHYENYESKKKKMCLESGLDMPEFLMLMSLYYRDDIISSEIYKTIYKYSFHSSRTRFKAAFGSLQNKGFIQKSGVAKGAKFKLTELGSNKFNEIVQKYFINV